MRTPPLSDLAGTSISESLAASKLAADDVNQVAWLFRYTNMIRLLAVFVTLIASSMATAAACDRGGTIIDKVLLGAMSLTIVLAVHLLPAISRRPASWLVWCGCLLCAIYGHLTFLTHASLRAGEERAQKSTIVVGTERQIELAANALAEIKARPVALVAAELAKSNDRRERAALREEIAEGRHAEAIRDGLMKLSRVSTLAQASESADPVTARIAAVTGWGESAVALLIGMIFSLMVELLGALIWRQALHPPLVSAGPVVTLVTTAATNATTDVSPVTTAATNVIIDAIPETPTTTRILQDAIKAGECMKTVSSIRKFLGCSQSRAIALRRELSSWIA